MLSTEDELIFKIIDRIYWVRYYGIILSSLSQEEKQKHLSVCRPLKGCAFGNPADTLTLIGYGIKLPPEEAEHLKQLKKLNG